MGATTTKVAGTFWCSMTAAVRPLLVRLLVRLLRVVLVLLLVLVLVLVRRLSASSRCACGKTGSVAARRCCT